VALADGPGTSCAIDLCDPGKLSPPRSGTASAGLFYLEVRMNYEVQITIRPVDLDINILQW